MIEVNLYSIPAGDPESTVGKCIARNRFDKESMGVSVMEFVKGFLKNNLSMFEGNLGNPDLVAMINSSSVLTVRDFSCINYYLTQIGYKVQIQNVADDEENATGVPSGSVIEWNVIDRNFIQYDYPTATKLMPGPDMDIPAILRQIVEQSGLFDSDKFRGIKNPFTELLNGLDKIKNVSGQVSPAITTKIYNLLDQLGISIFCASSED